MILLDTDAFTLHQYGQHRFMERFRTAAEAPAIAIVTQIETLRGRYDSIFKAKDGNGLLVAQHALILAVQQLARFQIVPFDGTAAAEFDRLRQIKGLKKIGRGDLLIASIALAQRATLVTRNVRDFRQVPRLLVENWAD